MGSYAELMIDGVGVASYKNVIPLEAMLLFSTFDFEESRDASQEDEDADYPWPIRRFVTTVAEAAARLDDLGIDLHTCRVWFEQFKEQDFMYFNHLKKRPYDDPEYVPLTLEMYEQHLSGVDIVALLMANNGDVGPYCSLKNAERLRPGIRDHDLNSFFTTESIVYYYDAIECLNLRLSLESFPGSSQIVLDISEVIDSGYSDVDDVSAIFDHYLKRMSMRVELDYKLYGLVLDGDPHLDKRLREKISNLNEDQFIQHVLTSLLLKMGFEGVKVVAAHGPGEFGADIGPFRLTTPFGGVEYYAVQAKAKRIHGSSSKQGNAGELLSQARSAFSVPFIDEFDHERKHIDKFIIATNKDVTTEARNYIQNSIEGNRSIEFLDIDRVVDLVKKNNLVRHILFRDA